ncbi:hypothetical protein ATANTOWER_002206 [Ataeniobius toweri]|uniref:Uncharacterized protein n=1 Tax=Ataeniobius toweri TaxID=208326 RepID=A0ABU7BWY6_9TELE|nr:hypothetical protein [Ataeniobius toweri]
MTNSNAKCLLAVKLTATGLWNSGDVFSGGTRHASFSFCFSLLRVTTSHLSSSNPIFCIFFSHTHYLHVLFHSISKSPPWSSKTPKRRLSAWNLNGRVWKLPAKWDMSVCTVSTRKSMQRV